jgi:hypothetical protein
MKHQERERIRKKTKDKLPKKSEDFMMPDDTMPGDSTEINSSNPMNNYKSNRQPLDKSSEKKRKDKNKEKELSFNTSGNNIKNISNQGNIIITKKKHIPLPKTNISKNGNSPLRSPNRSPNRNNSNLPNNNNDPNKKNNSNNASDISKEEIIKKINEILKEVDPRYLNPSFNLMSEIINVFGDVNFEKVKQDIERLKYTNTKLDDVIKLIVDKHSDEFFQILGYVRETKNIIESSKIKYDYAQVSLSNLTSNVSSLAINENMEWKLQSIFLNEIISRLSKTLHIFEILHECEEYIRNDKLYDAMNIINKTKEEHLNYDKEFRNYNLLVTINIRFNHIQKEINLKLNTGLKQVIFFDEFKVKDDFYK